MKRRIATLFAVLASAAYAEGIHGTVVDINDTAKTVLLETMNGERLNMKILPNTEIDMDDCGLFGMDKQGTFKDLKIGTFLEAEIFHGYSNAGTNQSQQVKDVSVKKIDIDCKKKAY